MWKHSNKLENVKSKSLDEIEIHYCKIYPALRHASLIASTLPSSNCNLEDFICFTTFLFAQMFDHHKSFGVDGASPVFQIVLLKILSYKPGPEKLLKPRVT